MRVRRCEPSPLGSTVNRSAASPTFRWNTFPPILPGNAAWPGAAIRAVRARPVATSVMRFTMPPSVPRRRTRRRAGAAISPSSETTKSRRSALGRRRSCLCRRRPRGRWSCSGPRSSRSSPYGRATPIGVAPSARPCRPRTRRRGHSGVARCGSARTRSCGCWPGCPGRSDVQRLERVRATTLSPLAITSCGVMEISANDALSQRTSPRKPSGPLGAVPAGDRRLEVDDALHSGTVWPLQMNSRARRAVSALVGGGRHAAERCARSRRGATVVTLGSTRDCHGGSLRLWSRQCRWAPSS